MSQRSGVKIQLEVDEASRHILDAQSKICNWLYNQLLERANELRAQFAASGGQDEEAARIVYSRRGLRDLVPMLKERHPFLRTVYSSTAASAVCSDPLKNTGLRLSASIRAYQQWRQGKRPGDEVGWPLPSEGLLRGPSTAAGKENGSAWSTMNPGRATG